MEKKGGTWRDLGPGGTRRDLEGPGVKGAREVESFDVSVVAARGALMSWHDLAISP